MVEEKRNIAAQNRKARHDFFILETLEAGIMLAGSEVKSLRQGKGNITEAFAGPKDGELWLHNAYIPEYQSKTFFTHETRRSRKLLLHRRQLNKLMAQIGREGVTVVPLVIYFNARGIAKVELGVAKGKKKHDRRESEKERDWKLQKARLMRDRG